MVEKGARVSKWVWQGFRCGVCVCGGGKHWWWWAGTDEETCGAVAAAREAPLPLAAASWSATCPRRNNKAVAAGRRQGVEVYDVLVENEKKQRKGELD